LAHERIDRTQLVVAGSLKRPCDHARVFGLEAARDRPAAFFMTAGSHGMMEGRNGHDGADDRIYDAGRDHGLAQEHA
jgi:hypothetical protein